LSSLFYFFLFYKFLDISLVAILPYNFLDEILL
jgi:hypothetical protein